MFRHIFHELKVQKSEEDPKAEMYGLKRGMWRRRDWMREMWRRRGWMNANLKNLDKQKKYVNSGREHMENGKQTLHTNIYVENTNQKGENINYIICIHMAMKNK